MNKAVARWRRGESLAAWEKALEKALENPVPADEEFDAVEPPKPLEQLGPAIDPWWFRFANIEDAWRWDAQAAGLSAQEIEESWAWYARHASGAPSVIEEGERALPETMPESVRRVLTRNIRYVFLAEDPLVDDLLDAFKQPIPIPNDLQRVADDWQFWDDVGRALAPSDPPDADDRKALDRFAHLVKLKSEQVRQLAKQNDASMEATKRHLIHLAVVDSVAAADAPIRIGRRIGKDEAGHPIRLQDVFGEDGLKEILSDLLRNNLGSRNQETSDEIRDNLERSLGGPFRPARLTDRAIHRNWLTKEIRRRTGELLGQDLDIRDATRLGGSRRPKDVPYDETDHSVPGVTRRSLGPGTRAFTENQMLADGEREDRDETRPGSHNYTEPLAPWDVEDRRMEEEEARVAFAQMTDQVWRQHEAPVIREYLACIQEEPRLLDDDAEVARRLAWPDWKPRDVKRRLKRQLAQRAARHAYADWHAAYLAETRRGRGNRG